MMFQEKEQYVYKNLHNLIFNIYNNEKRRAKKYFENV